MINDANRGARTNVAPDGCERNRAVSPTTQAGGRTRDLRDGGSTCHGSHQQEKGTPLCLQPPPSLALALFCAAQCSSPFCHPYPSPLPSPSARARAPFSVLNGSGRPSLAPGRPRPDPEGQVKYGSGQRGPAVGQAGGRERWRFFRPPLTWADLGPTLDPEIRKRVVNLQKITLKSFISWGRVKFCVEL